MKRELCPAHSKDKTATHIFKNLACPICCPNENEGVRFGRYMTCSICDGSITSERDAFTSNKGRVSCQMCGLKEILNSQEWYTIFAIQSGLSDIISLRQKCSSLRTFPPNSEESIVEFSSPDGKKFCIVR